MKRVAIAAIVAALLTGCAAAPMTAGETTQAQRVVWTKVERNDVNPFRDTAGACHVFSKDTRDSMWALGEQLRACFNGTLPTRAASSSGVAVSMTWHRVPLDNMPGAIAEIMGYGGRGRGWTSSNLFDITGFYKVVGGVCHVLVGPELKWTRVLGHEGLHCFVGKFHDAHETWYNDDKEASNGKVYP